MWTNWAGDQSCVPAVRERPRSTAEVAAAIARAAEAGRAVRVAGAGHSFSDCVLTDGTLLSLEHMGEIVGVDGDRVRVQAGADLHALNRTLHERGLALPNLGDIDVQALGGAIATGTHGTGAARFNISAQVEAVQLVDGRGEVREIDGGDELLAARVSLGALGVVTEITLRCVPAFRLHGTDRRERADDVLADLEARATGATHFELFTFPHSPWCVTRTNEPTDAPAAPRPAWRERVEDEWLENRLFDVFCRIGRARPSVIPRMNRMAGRLMSERERVDHSYRIFASHRSVRFAESEHAVPRADAAEAVLAVREALERHPVNFPIELRFVAADDALLSPSHARDSAYIAVHVYRGMAFEPVVRDVEAVLSRYRSRPHWGKRSYLTADELAPRYPRWEDFRRIRAGLDPDGRFTNAFTARMLGS